MKPLTQGQLDGFCGIYSILNSLTLVQGTSYQESRELFFEILRAMEARKKILKLIEDGMTDRDMGYVYREIIQKRYPVRTFKPFHKQAGIALGSYWDQVHEFLEHGKRRAVNLVTEGWDWGHWTVVYKATPKSFHLLDSDMMRRLDRRKCTTQRLSINRNFLLWPTMTRFLFRNE